MIFDRVETPQNYRKDIDGLRAIAVTTVILFHFEYTFFINGFLGVDLFFIISGYVVTKSLHDNIVQNTLSIKDFYYRRILRLIPALYVMLVISCIIAFILLQPNQIYELLTTAMSTILLASNFQLYLDTGYFSVSAHLKPLLHMWSLSVEEQFYLIYPIFILLITKRCSTVIKFSIIGVIVILGFGISAIATKQIPSFSFYMMPFRIWELCLGSICFYMSPLYSFISKDEKYKNSFLNIIFCGLILTFIFPSDKVITPGLGALPLAILASILLIIPSKTALYYRLLTSSSFVVIGLMSYSLYIWHQPVIAFFKNSNLEVNVFSQFFLICILLAVSTASYKFIEVPFRYGRDKKKTRIKLIIIGLSTFLLLTILYTVRSNDTYIKIWKNFSNEKDIETYIVLNDRKYLRVGDTDGKNTYGLNGKCKIISTELSKSFTEDFKDCANRPGNMTLLIGDSHAMNIFNGLAYNSNTNSKLFSIAKPRWRPSDKGYQADNILKFIGNNKDLIQNIIYTQSGRYFLKYENKVPSRQIMSENREIDFYSQVSIDAQSIAKTILFLKRIENLYHNKILFYGPRIEPHVNELRIIHKGCEYDDYVNKNLIEKFKSLDLYLSHLFSSENMAYVSQIDDLEIKFPGDFLNCKEIYWFDGDHYSTNGEHKLLKRSKLIKHMANQDGL